MAHGGAAMAEIMRSLPDWWLGLWGVSLLCWAVMLCLRGLRRAVLVPLAAAVLCVLPFYIAAWLKMGEQVSPALALVGVSPVIVLAVTVLTLAVVAWRGRRAAGEAAGDQAPEDSGR